MNDPSGLIVDQSAATEPRRHLFSIGPDLVSAANEEDAWFLVCAFYMCGRDHFEGDSADLIPDDELVWLGLEDEPDEWLRRHAIEIQENDGGWRWRVRAPAWVWANEPGTKVGLVGSSEW